MIHNKRFYKEKDGRWYIDLPEYIKGGYGTKSNLEMVAGADKLLDDLSEGKSDVNVTFSDEPIDDCKIQLVKRNTLLNVFGCHYKYYKENETEPKNVWLCPVTLYVFNNSYPKNIYAKVS